MTQLTTQQLHAISEAGGAYLLDVRGEDEYRSGHVAGAVNIPHTAVASRVDEVPSGQPVYVFCARGGRAMHAARALEQAGRDVHVVSAGGMLQWRELGLPLVG